MGMPAARVGDMPIVVDAATVRSAPAPSRLRESTSTMPSRHIDSDVSRTLNGMTAMSDASMPGARRK